MSAERDAEPWSGAGLVHRAEPAAGEWPEGGGGPTRPSLLTTKLPVGRPVAWVVLCRGRWPNFFLSLGKKGPLVSPPARLTAHPTVRGTEPPSVSKPLPRKSRPGRELPPTSSAGLSSGWRAKGWAEAGAEG